MLRELGIRNYALIEETRVQLEPGLTVVTGETGAGKSMMFDALLIALGERAGADRVRPGAERAEIEAVFEQPCTAALEWLQAQDLDDGDDCVVRRVIRGDGRSRLHINGRSASAQQVRELAGLLLDVQGQHAFHGLLSGARQRELLDAYGGHAPLLAEVGAAARTLRTARERLAAWRSGSSERAERREALARELDEFAALALGDEEWPQLDAAHRRAGSARDLLDGAGELLDSLEADGGVQSALAQLAQRLAPLLRVDPGLERVHDLLDTARIQIDEAQDELRHYLATLNLDPDELETLERRMTLAHRLSRRHQIDPAGLPALHRELLAEAAQLGSGDEDDDALQQALAQAETAWSTSSARLSEARAGAAARLGGQVRELLAQLAMPDASFDIALEPRGEAEPAPAGNEHVRFLFSANPGLAPAPLRDIASGGELARVSLAIHVATLQQAGSVDTLVFDEADVGIGGAVAEIVGRLLRQLGSHAQVLCITHQPQVASLGHHHWHVLKQQGKKETRTEIINLDENRRVEEVARMLGGVEITDSTLTHAREMLQRSQTN